MHIKQKKKGKRKGQASCSGCKTLLDDDCQDYLNALARQQEADMWAKHYASLEALAQKQKAQMYRDHYARQKVLKDEQEAQMWRDIEAGMKNPQHRHLYERLSVAILLIKETEKKASAGET